MIAWYSGEANQALACSTLGNSIRTIRCGSQLALQRVVCPSADDELAAEGRQGARHLGGVLLVAIRIVDVDVAEDVASHRSFLPSRLCFPPRHGSVGWVDRTIRSAQRSENDSDALSTFPSPYTHSLESVFNADRATLDGGLAPWSSGRSAVTDASEATAYFGDQVYSGIPFSLGSAGQPNVLLLSPGDDDVRIDTERPARDVRRLPPCGRRPGPARSVYAFPGTGVSSPATRSAVGSRTTTSSSRTAKVASTRIARRFAIQQRRITWGASPFAAVPALGPSVYTTASEDRILRARRPWHRRRWRVPRRCRPPGTLGNALALRPAQSAPRRAHRRPRAPAPGRALRHLRHLDDDTAGPSPAPRGTPETAPHPAGGRRRSMPWVSSIPTSVILSSASTSAR